MSSSFQWRTFSLGVGVGIALTAAIGGAIVSSTLGWPALWNRLTRPAGQGMHLHREDRLSLFAGLPRPPAGAILFVGDSIIEGGAWFELFGANTPILNRGISGDTVAGLRARVEPMLALKPKAVFVAVGINDLLAGRRPAEIIPEFAALVRQLRDTESDVIVHGVLPVNANLDSRLAIAFQEIQEMNRQLKALAEAEGITFLDAGLDLRDANGRLDRRYTSDGLHLSSVGYLRWKSRIREQLAQLPSQSFLNR